LTRTSLSDAPLIPTDWSRVLVGKHPRWDLQVRRYSLARPHHVAALKADAEFRRTGRVDERGITVRVYPAGTIVVADGKHRLTAAWELGLPSIWGRVILLPWRCAYAGVLWLHLGRPR
jgi:hypothetical protein